METDILPSDIDSFSNVLILSDADNMVSNLAQELDSNQVFEIDVPCVSTNGAEFWVTPAVNDGSYCICRK